MTFWYTTLFSLTFILLAGAAYWMLDYSLSREVDSALNSVSNVLVEQVRKSASPIFPHDVDDIFRRFFGFSPLNQYYEMLDPSGRPDRQRLQRPSGKLPLSPKALENVRQGLPTYETLTELDQYPVRILTMPVIKGNRVINMVQVGSSLENIIKTRKRFLFIAMILIPFSMLLAGGGGWLLARRALKPVDHMTSAAERISAAALSDRLEVSDTGDELDRLAKTLNRMLSRLGDAFSQTRRFSADASHELQTPLTILKGELEVSLRSERTTKEYRQVLISALEEINRLTHMVEGLLLLTRADGGVLKMDLKPMDPYELVKDVFHKAEILAQEKDINLKLGNLKNVLIKGDYEQLRRLLINLINNAVKYTPAGGQVEISLNIENRCAAVQVADTGSGIPFNEQERIFEPFYRTREAEMQGKKGVGLGLSIARSIAEAHQGKIRLESTPGVGSTFKVLIPVIPDPEEGP